MVRIKRCNLCSPQTLLMALSCCFVCNGLAAPQSASKSHPRPTAAKSTPQKTTKPAPKVSQKPAHKPASPSHHTGAKLGAVTIAGVSVSGLTPDEASRRVTRLLGKKLNQRIVLTDGVRKLTRTRQQLGLGLDVNGMVRYAQAGHKRVMLHLAVNVAALQRTLRRVAPRFAFEGRDARITESRGRVRILKDQPTRQVDVGRSAQQIAQVLDKHPDTTRLRLAVKTTPRQRTAASFKGITGVLSRFATSFNAGNAKRTRNMRLAIAAIDGTVISAGGVFSLNQTVGERNQARGYRTGITFKNGYKVPDIGAGVSQVTGTLFNAALLAGLPIVEYRTHSRPVKYLSLGRDATVSYGNFDMKFKNSTTAPVYVSYKITGSRAIATLLGKPIQNQRVSLTVRAQRKGPRLITAQLYRTIRNKGKVVTKHLVGTSHYEWKPDPPAKKR